MDRFGRIAGVALLAAVTTASAAVVPVPGPQQKAWLRWLVPLPKEVAIERMVTLPVADVGIRLRERADETEHAAAEELRALLEGKTEGAAFEILLGVVDAEGKVAGVAVPDAARLTTLPNKQQAYVIRPVGPSRLVLAALDSRGVYYAAQTLRQLLESTLADGRVSIPLATVTDWPDLAERGLWGGNANHEILWLARHKMNLVESHVKLGLTEDGRGRAQADQALIGLGRRHALNFVPILTHLDQLHRSGIYERYPELRGKGKKAGNWNGRAVAPCFAQPMTGKLIADWMADLAAQPGVTDVCAWLSESHVQCGCPTCSKAGQFVMETRAVVAAWQQARKKHPKLGLRILLTQGSYTTNDKVLAAAPEGVGITYYDGGRTYDSSRDPMIYPLLEQFAAKGRWLGCYPQLTASWRIVCPWSGPQFIRTRMNEFVDKKLQCLCGYATPNNRLYDFNIMAAAEWSWNAKGRDEREFAAAWATRRGLKDADAVARWAVTLGDVAWNVYGSGIPYPQFFGRAAAMVRGRKKPVLGEGLFRYFPSPERIDADLAACRKALALASQFGDPVILAETEAVGAYVQMVREIARIGRLHAAAARPDDTARAELQRAMAHLSAAGHEAAAALRTWERLIGEGAGSSRFVDTVDVTEKTVVDIGDALEPLGIVNPLKPYLRGEIGAWTTQDFAEKERLTKTFEVTDHVTVAGEYAIGFKYTTGWWGLNVHRVALASAPAGEPPTLTTLSEDKHDGVAAARNKANVYTVKLAKHDRALRYFVVVDLKGITSRGKPANRQGCNGSVWMKARMPDDWRQRLQRVKPLTREEMNKRAAAAFTGAGLRVGVVAGGYGATAILAALRKAKGIDAQPIGGVGAETLQRCQVVVLPQPKSPFGTAAATALEQFVRQGGGLLATHNAVGYRGHPLVLTSVCKRGLQHVRETQWVAVAKHPVTRGIALNAPLPHSYFDHVELEPGPQGTVLAVAPESKRPVVLCGEPGKGRYVACGLCIGLAPSNADAPPTQAESVLLENAVRWCGRQEHP